MIGSAVSALAPVSLSAGVGVFMLVLAALAGLLIAHHPAGDLIDAWGLALLPARPDSITYHDVAELASVPALVVGIVATALITVRSDPRRAHHARRRHERLQPDGHCDRFAQRGFCHTSERWRWPWCW